MPKFSANIFRKVIQMMYFCNRNKKCKFINTKKEKRYA